MIANIITQNLSKFELLKFCVLLKLKTTELNSQYLLKTMSFTLTKLKYNFYLINKTKVWMSFEFYSCLHTMSFT